MRMKISLSQQWQTKRMFERKSVEEAILV